MSASLWESNRGNEPRSTRTKCVGFLVNHPGQARRVCSHGGGDPDHGDSGVRVGIESSSSETKRQWAETGVSRQAPTGLQFRSTTALKLNAFWPRAYLTVGEAGSVGYDDMVVATERERPARSARAPARVMR
jgi:hypothetical protein